jgi:flagellar capping protein FliD
MKKSLMKDLIKHIEDFEEINKKLKNLESKKTDMKDDKELMKEQEKYYRKFFKLMNEVENEKNKIH